MNGARFAIAGGGIGGLAAALSLAQNGVASVVLEQATRFGEIGAGIQLGPNAFHCFDYLGIGDAARDGAVYVDQLRLMDSVSGDEICHIPLDDEFRQRFRNPYAVVHRADLHETMRAACVAHELIDLQTHQRVTGYESAAAGVRISVADTDELYADALIGADGLNSSVRAQMLNDGPPRVSGHTTYRSVIPVEQMPEDLRWNAATLWAGPKCHIVHYPLKGGEVFNLVVTYHNDVKEAVAGKPVSRDEVRKGFEHIHPRAQQVIEHGTDWKLWVLCDRDPIENWVDGRVALLGDAAHPMMQYLAQGACMAMEDAVCLGDTMGQAESVESGLNEYCRRRVFRTARVVLGSRLMGDHVYHPAGIEADVRNAIMGSRTRDEWYERMQWLYGSNGLDI